MYFNPYNPIDNKRYKENQDKYKRLNIKYNTHGHCKKCGRLYGDHLSDYALEKNPNACKGDF